ncbi:MAG: hypothetical protein L0Y58_16580 [Verrucomicrobia subdivision 3 bacterium]|nr:hypothetical protein [Limisphaerales bacterium]
MKSRNNKSPSNKPQEISLQTEELEQRIAPGILTIPTDHSIHLNGDIEIATDNPMDGLNKAEAHTGGVISWTPDA